MFVAHPARERIHGACLTAGWRVSIGQAVCECRRPSTLGFLDALPCVAGGPAHLMAEPAEILGVDEPSALNVSIDERLQLALQRLAQRHRPA